MEFALERQDLISILMSVFCGSIIGFEREYNNKSAGFRTIILICLGSTIFTIVSRHGHGSDDRISANIITGIGFIGAGVIFKDKFSVLGLTTAAVIWTTAGIGMANGIGYHLLALSMTTCTVLVLSLFGKIEYLIERLHNSKSLTITFRENGLQPLEQLEQLMADNHIRSKRMMLNKMNDHLFAVIRVTGKHRNLVWLNETLVATESVIEFYYSS
jgi:putative Mg2+ transporter-C (MgtC) family protein